MGGVSGYICLGSGKKLIDAARDWAELGQEADNLKALGLSDDDLDIEIELWPDNALPMQVFMAMQTQWRIGMGGATGLDYSALPVVEDRLNVPKKRRAECFKGLQIIEREVLRVWSEAAKARQNG